MKNQAEFIPLLSPESLCHTPSSSLPTAVAFMYNLMFSYLIMQIMISFTLVGLFMSSVLQTWHHALQRSLGFSIKWLNIQHIMKEHLC